MSNIKSMPISDILNTAVKLVNDKKLDATIRAQYLDGGNGVGCVIYSKVGNKLFGKIEMDQSKIVVTGTKILGWADLFNYFKEVVEFKNRRFYSRVI